MEWMQNLFWKYLLCFLIASVFFSLVRFFSVLLGRHKRRCGFRLRVSLQPRLPHALPAKQKKRNERKKRLTTQVSQILYRDFLYHSRTSHYLLIIKNMIVLRLSVTPFSLARPSSLRKEGKSAKKSQGNPEYLLHLFKLKL